MASKQKERENTKIEDALRQGIKLKRKLSGSGLEGMKSKAKSASQLRAAGPQPLAGRGGAIVKFRAPPGGGGGDSISGGRGKGKGKGKDFRGKSGGGGNERGGKVGGGKAYGGSKGKRKGAPQKGGKKEGGW